MAFVKAARRQKKLRLGIAGPPGSGKTLTALRFAMALARMDGGTGRVAVIDTENKSASLYANDQYDGGRLVFDVDTLDDYAPTTYTAAIKEAGRQRYDVVVVDSWTHAWSGEGGALDIKDKSAGKSGNQFTAWKEVTPLHNAMVEAMLQSPCHVIVTMRTKIEYELVQEERNGRIVTVPKKIGTKVIQREGAEYEFDIFGDMEADTHLLKISKTRCSAIDGKSCIKPGAAFLLPVIEWLNEGGAGPVEAAKEEITPSSTSNWKPYSTPPPGTEKTAFELFYERVHAAKSVAELSEIGKEVKKSQAAMKPAEFDLLVSKAKERKGELAKQEAVDAAMPDQKSSGPPNESPAASGELAPVAS